MKIAAVVILYHPEAKTIENILSYSNKVSKLYVVDNTACSDTGLVNVIRAGISNSEYIHDGENAGIAKRLNQVCTRAMEEGFDYIMTMDQDSSFEPDSIKNYFDCIDSYMEKQQAALFGLQHEYPAWASHTCDPETVTQLITSGTIVNLSLFDKIGRFDEDLFIDLVDFEYCYRCIVNHFLVIRFRNIFLKHSIGTIKPLKQTIISKEKERGFHSPLRLYYMVRNYLYLRPKYKKRFPTEFAINRKAILNRIKNNLLYSNKKFETLRFISRAIIDVKRNRMGKYSKK